MTKFEKWYDKKLFELLNKLDLSVISERSLSETQQSIKTYEKLPRNKNGALDCYATSTLELLNCYAISVLELK